MYSKTKEIISLLLEMCSMNMFYEVKLSNISIYKCWEVSMMSSTTWFQTGNLANG
jgi:hypothetical protein